MAQQPRKPQILCMEIDHKHVYKFCVKYCLHVNNYKHDNSAKLSGYMCGKFNVMGMCISLNYAQKLNKSLDINSAWENIRHNIKTSARETLGYHRLKHNKP
jgi:hypothetical protein